MFGGYLFGDYNIMFGGYLFGDYNIMFGGYLFGDYNIMFGGYNIMVSGYYITFDGNNNIFSDCLYVG
jgi:hypothetical protein